jgi:hypothetical protein
LWSFKSSYEYKNAPWRSVEWRNRFMAPAPHSKASRAQCGNPTRILTVGVVEVRMCMLKQTMPGECGF